MGEAGDGEVLLAPTSGTEFSGSALPRVGSRPHGRQVAGRRWEVDRSRSTARRVGRTSTFAAGRTLEFAATFSGAAHQHVGFGVDFNSQPWAMFSTAGGGGLFARTNGTSTQIAGNWFGSPHLFRIEWTTTGATYFIDGQQVASQAVGIATPMRPLVSDFDLGGGNIVLNWLRMSPYSATGTFTSRVLDAGAVAAWGAATWNADVPTGTALGMSVRTGNSPTPDGTWSNFTPLASSGATVGASARYLQYRVSSTSSNGSATPVLRDISFQVGGAPPNPDTTPPTITAVTATPAAAGTSATITWTTNEPGTSRVDYGTSAGTLNQTVNDPALVSSHSVNLPGLTPGTTYFFRVRSTDASTNEATSPVAANPPASFVTPNPDTTPPTITAVTATPAAAGTSATITWTTNEPGTSRVDYGTSAGTLNQTVNDPALVSSHSVNLPGLTPGTTYFFRVRSTDASTNEATSPVAANPPASFVTPNPDTTPPTITAVTATPAAAGTSATITWTTNEPGTSRVDYGTSAGTLNQTVNDPALVSSHSVNLPGLTPGTTYFFRVRSTDASTNEATSPVAANPPASFVTPNPDTTPPTITAVTATPAAAGTSATITWTTDELGLRVDYGTAPGSLNLNASNDAALVTAHSIT